MIQWFSLASSIFEIALIVIPMSIVLQIDKNKVRNNEVFSENETRFKLQKAYYGFLLIFAALDGFVALILSFVETSVQISGILKIVQNVPLIITGLVSQIFVALAVDMYTHDQDKSLKFKKVLLTFLILYSVLELFVAFLSQALTPYSYVFQYMMIFDMVLSGFGFLFILLQNKHKKSAANIITQQVLVCCCHLVTAGMELVWGWMLDAEQNTVLQESDWIRLISDILCKLIFFIVKAVAFIPVNTLVENLMCFRTGKIKVNIDIFQGNNMEEQLIYQ